MKRAILKAARSHELCAAAPPEPRDDEVVVRVRASGVCASELHAWRNGDGAPRPLGHEVAGEVSAVGSAARAFRVGDRVTGLFQRGFAEYAVAPVDRVTLVPAVIALEHAFAEPLACAVSAADRTRIAPGDRVVVIGLGFMGLLMLQLLRLKTPSALIGVDLREEARARAIELGADAVFAPAELGDDARLVLPITAGDSRGYDVVVEATGTQDGITLAGELVKLHGVMSILGYHQGGSRCIDMQLWNYKAIDVVNAHERRVDVRMACMKRGLALAAAGRVEVARLATHRFRLDEIDRAFEALETKPPGFVKSIIVCDPLA